MYTYLDCGLRRQTVQQIYDIVETIRNFHIEWRTGKSGLLQSIGLQKSQIWLSDWATTLTEYLMILKCYCFKNKRNSILCCASLLSHVWLFGTPWTVTHQAALSLEFSRQEYWSGLSWPPPGDPPNPGTEPRSPALQIHSLTSEPPG